MTYTSTSSGGTSAVGTVQSEVNLDQQVEDLLVVEVLQVLVRIQALTGVTGGGEAGGAHRGGFGGPTKELFPP